ncbi:MAG TPA: DNA internalization-related competence protein ComEC/Rec2 [Clostridia bacterium]|nr:DNA internalization-related competence protein ComEC/Rec2 [Clostridia bacterium]
MSIIYKRPIVSFCIMQIAGIAAVFLSNSFLVVISLFFLLFVCAFVFSKAFTGGAFVPVAMLAFFLLGSLEFLFADRIQLSSFARYNGCEVTVRGHVVSEPELKNGKVVYTVKVAGIRKGYVGDFEKSNGKILLSTLPDADAGFFDFGREITFEGLLTQPKGVRNPGGFDYRRYLAQKGVGASVFAYPYAIETGKEKRGNFLVQTGLSIRNRIVDVIQRSLPHQQAGLLNGMLIGYREGLSEEVQEAFSNAGLTHIMAVSGANVAFLILPLTFLLKLLHIKKKAANIMIIAFLAMFVFVTGFEPSVLRAVLMADVLLVSAVLYREPDVYAALAVSSIILLAISPGMLFNIGFQLSYGATLGIVMLYKNISRLVTCRFIPGKAAEVLAATLSAQLGVLPLTLIHFNRLSVISILPNILAAPLLELITILGMLMAVLGQFSIALSQLIGYLNNVFLSALLYITKWSSSVPFATIRTVTPPILLAALYYFCVWFLLWYKPLKGIRIRLRHAAAVIITVTVIFTISGLKAGCLEVIFLDVGEGDSAFIRTYKGSTVMIDGGGSTNPLVASKVGEQSVVPFLLDSGVMRLDAVIATHPHADHTQGLEDVIETLKVGRLIIPSVSDESGFSGILGISETRDIPVTRCAEGDVIRLDEKTTLRVLSPVRGCNTDEDALNNTSLVLKLCYDKTSILLTGDAEKEVEAELVGGHGAVIASGGSVSAPDIRATAPGAPDLRADVIKIAHHGSTSSTSPDFLAMVDPRAAIISVGKNNFGHPSEQTLKLLEERAVECFRTDECGAVLLRSNGKTIKIIRTVEEKAG